MGKIHQFLNQIKTDPRVRELVRGKAVPKTDDEAIDAYADLAQKLGFDLSLEEIRKGLRSLILEHRAKSRAADREVEKAAMGDGMLDQIVGGSGNKCKSPTDDDWCWWEDVCDRLIEFS